MRRRGEVEEHGVAGDVLADGDVERAGRRGRLRGEEQVAEGDELAGVVGHLDADRRLARDRGEDAHVGGGHRVGDVALQRRHPGHLHAGPELELVARDGRTDGHPDERRVDTVLLERLLEDPPAPGGLALVDALRRRRGGAAATGGSTQLPGPVPAAGVAVERLGRRRPLPAPATRRLPSSPSKSSAASYGAGGQGEGDRLAGIVDVGSGGDGAAVVVVALAVAAQRRQVAEGVAGGPADRSGDRRRAAARALWRSSATRPG